MVCLLKARGSERQSCVLVSHGIDRRQHAVVKAEAGSPRAGTQALSWRGPKTELLRRPRGTRAQESAVRARRNISKEGERELSQREHESRSMRAIERRQRLPGRFGRRSQSPSSARTEPTVFEYATGAPLATPGEAPTSPPFQSSLRRTEMFGEFSAIRPLPGHHKQSFDIRGRDAPDAIAGASDSPRDDATLMLRPPSPFRGDSVTPSVDEGVRAPALPSAWAQPDATLPSTPTRLAEGEPLEPPTPADATMLPPNSTPSRASVPVRQTIRWHQLSRSLWRALLCEAPSRGGADAASVHSFLDAMHWRMLDKISEREMSLLYAAWHNGGGDTTGSPRPTQSSASPPLTSPALSSQAFGQILVACSLSEVRGRAPPPPARQACETASHSCVTVAG